MKIRARVLLVLEINSKRSKTAAENFKMIEKATILVYQSSTQSQRDIPVSFLPNI